MNPTNQLDAGNFQKVARAIASKANVSVEFGGSHVTTQNETLTLPAIHKHKDQDVLLGHVVRECGRVRETDFSVPTDKFTNIFEGQRAELHMQSILGGGEELMVKTWKHLLQQEELPDVESSTPFSSVKDYLKYKGQEVTMKRNSVAELASDHVKIAKESVEKHWGNISLMLDAFLTRSKYLSSTQDAFDISEEIHHHLMNLKPDEESPEQEDQDDQDSNDSGDEQENTNGGSEEIQGEGDQPNPSSSDSNTLGVDNDTLEQSKAALQAAFDKGDKAEDMGDQIGGMLDSIIEESIEEHGAAPAMPGLACRQEVIGGSLNNIIQQNAEAISENVSQAIRLLVETQSRNRVQAKRRGKKPLTSKLAKVAVGETRVFGSRVHKTAIDTAVTIAVDMSGSMRGSRADTALASSIGLAKALQVTRGTSGRMTVFPGYQCDVEQVAARGTTPDPSITGLNANGGTPLLSAVEDAVIELQHQRSNKKVAIVITDGDVYSDDMENALDVARNGQVELLWIAISVDHFPISENVIHVNNPKEMPEALLTHAKGMF